jgi:hypothetical protein
MEALAMKLGEVGLVVAVAVVRGAQRVMGRQAVATLLMIGIAVQAAVQPMEVRSVEK